VVQRIIVHYMAQFQATETTWEDIFGDGAVLKRVIVAGFDEQSTPPPKYSVVCVNYEGMLLDGSVFDTKNDFHFRLGKGEVIKAWDVAVAKMNIGEMALIKCLPSFAYGDEGCRDLIPPKATLIFKIELVSFEARPTDPSALKELGNSLLLAKDLLGALEAYSEAISFSPKEDSCILFSNRSMCNAALGDHAASLADAIECTTISPSWPKGWWRKASAELTLGLTAEAAKSIDKGVVVEAAVPADKSKGRPSEFSKLRKALLAPTSLEAAAAASASSPKKPTAKDFTIGEELGVGNFTQICLATKKTTSEVFALKVIQKAEVERMKKRRHPNISNEVNMERRALAKLKHPGIVTLFSTFQDHYSLYFQMEFLPGGELWCKINDNGSMVGAPESLVRFWMAEVVDAIEYVHSQGIVHRDLKPENLMLTADGHVKVIDFGTAKDLVTTDLNGPEFVGTPEYMSPEMVTGSPPTSYAADLWAIGVITQQLLTGRTPFKAPSPYLSFLRIKRGVYSLPEALSPSAVDFISSLLLVRPDDRLGITGQTPGDLSSMKNHSFFAQLPSGWGEGLRSTAVRIPRLSELCVRAVAQATIASRTRDKRLLELGPLDRGRVMHYLSRLKRLHEPRVFRSFFSSLSDTRCLQARTCTKEMIGLEHEDQGKWSEPFALVHLSVGKFLKVWAEDQGGGAAAASLKKIVSAVNRLRPRVCVVSLGDGLDGEALSDDTLASFRQVCARVSESIPLAFVSASRSPAARFRHTQLFNADFFGFWYGGMRALVLNSALIMDEECDPSASADQESWFDGEVEQGQLGGHHVVVFSNHCWFQDSPLEDDEMPGVIPVSSRLRWLQKMKLGKVRALFTGATANAGNKSRCIRADDLPEDPKAEHSDSDGDEDGPKEQASIEFVITASGTEFSDGFRVVSVFEDHLEHNFFATGDMPDRTELFKKGKPRK